MIKTSNISRRTVCVTCGWADVDNAWEQGKLEAKKMLVNRVESLASGARFVRRVFAYQTLCH